MVEPILVFDYHLLLGTLRLFALRPWFDLLSCGCGELCPRDEEDQGQGGDVCHDPGQGGQPRVVVPSNMRGDIRDDCLALVNKE